MPLEQNYDIRAHLTEIRDRRVRKEGFASATLSASERLQRHLGQHFMGEHMAVRVERENPTPDQLTELRANVAKVRDWLFAGNGKRGPEHPDFREVLTTRTPEQALGYFGYMNDWVSLQADRARFVPRDQFSDDGDFLMLQTDEEGLAGIDLRLDFDDSMELSLSFDGAPGRLPIGYQLEGPLRAINGDMYLISDHYLNRVIKEVIS